MLHKLEKYFSETYKYLFEIIIIFLIIRSLENRTMILFDQKYDFYRVVDKENFYRDINMNQKLKQYIYYHMEI